ncbi:MAG: type II secretion system minor pseudopilin GspH [Halofilum sp. (in: g-proteobacteria)]|nr:type II secretion system minor pseudopilin GspH [Halofilum sp. (in: g-proteobacteria)]
MSAAGRSHGFTLIELLVVIALIGVLAATVVLSIPAPSTAERLHTEAQRLQARMTLAREEAVLRARTFGLHVESDGYSFLQRTDTGWATARRRPSAPRPPAAGAVAPRVRRRGSQHGPGDR